MSTLDSGLHMASSTEVRGVGVHQRSYAKQLGSKEKKSAKAANFADTSSSGWPRIRPSLPLRIEYYILSGSKLE